MPQNVQSVLVLVARILYWVLPTALGIGLVLVGAFGDDFRAGRTSHRRIPVWQGRLWFCVAAVLFLTFWWIHMYQKWIVGR